MEIILKKDVENLGYTHDIVKVKHGYARNYLIPQGFAVLATPSAKKEVAEILKQKAHKLAKLVKDAETLAQALENVTVKITVKANEEGKIFGSVTGPMIVEALGKQYGYEIDPKKVITPDNHIKALGSYEIKVKLHKEIEPVVKVEVTSETE
ncbi:MAG: 50S ribosomal protein L9 [Bacteroidales bacterium]|jgi:large subunit ribosomal protein L9|nr:50S ribosomal protein L9 [Bacteroidales bacterium]